MTNKVSDKSIRRLTSAAARDWLHQSWCLAAHHVRGADNRPQCRRLAQLGGAQRTPAAGLLQLQHTTRQQGRQKVCVRLMHSTKKMHFVVLPHMRLWMPPPACMLKEKSSAGSVCRLPRDFCLQNQLLRQVTIALSAAAWLNSAGRSARRLQTSRRLILKEFI